MEDYKIGDKIILIDPFSDHLPGEFTIKETRPEFVLLEEIDSAFSYIFIKKV